VALAPFFERVYGALAGHLAVTRESLNAVLANVTVGVACGDEAHENDMWIAELSTNILSRLYPRIAISGPDKLHLALQDLAARINPNIEFAQDAACATTICVGSAATEGALFPKATGWVARVQHAPSRLSGPANPYAAAAAAALGCSELFRRVFVKRSAEPDVTVSLLNFDDHTGARTKLTDASVNDVLFVGVGAVGNAALWTLARHAGLRGRLLLVDPEELSLLNLQRYVLGCHADVARSKVSLGRRALEDSSLVIEEHHTSLEALSTERGGIDMPTIAVSLDNIGGRRAAQALLPRVVVSGWTGDRALGASWHVFSRDAACLACLYHPHGQGLSATDQAARALGLSSDRATLLWVTRQPLLDDDIRAAASTLGVDEIVLAPWRGKPLGDLYTDVVCGAVPLDLKGVGKVETVPLAHQSVLAGVLMAAELLKRTEPELDRMSQSEPLVSWDDVLQRAPAIWPKPRARETGCICGDADYQTVYKKKWAKAVQRS
jgi:hypothetical protein